MINPRTLALHGVAAVVTAETTSVRYISSRSLSRSRC